MVSNVATTAPSTALPSSSVKSLVFVIVNTGASFAVVTPGATETASPSVVPSLGISVNAGNSWPLLTNSAPASVSTTEPSTIA